MKKILKLTLLVTLLTNLLTAETIFDLSQQHFANSLARKGVGARYNLPKVYVSTPLQYSAGQYWVKNASSQIFQVEMKNAISDWSVSFDLSYFFITNKIQPIRLTDTSGKIFSISFSHNNIFVNGVSIYNSTDKLNSRTEISATISKIGDEIQVSIAGITSQLFDSNFDRLKLVTINIGTDYFNYTTYYNALRGLTISH